MLVEQLANKNQFKVFLSNGVAFQSYDSLIAFKCEGKIYLSNKWDYSNTTLKHLKLFLNISISKKDIKKKIENGAYILVGNERSLKRIMDKKQGVSND